MREYTTRARRQQLDSHYRRQLHDARFALALGFASFLALLWYYSRQELLLYGDAVAHINIARRVLDTRHLVDAFEGFGTPWLPLQHFAMLPFVWAQPLWQSGIAGAIPSMIAYVLGGLGIYRLVNARAQGFPAYLAAGIYALNPNLFYMQTTAMNEPILLAFFIWSLVYLDDFVQGASPAAAGVSVEAARVEPNKAIEFCGITLGGAVMTRYDGWFIAAAVGVVVAIAFVAWWRRTRDGALRRRMAKSFAEFLLFLGLLPVFWLVYNNSVSGHALDFINGPYSAKAIALRSTAANAPPYPGEHNLLTAIIYFLKAAKLNVGPGTWGQILFALALAGSAIAIWQRKRFGLLLLLWLPLPFYALSIAHGSVPIFLPVWYPFSYYNVRYGLELLPVFAVFSAVLAAWLSHYLREQRRWAACVAVAALFAVSYAVAWQQTPITLQEARANSATRLAMEHALANFFVRMPPSGTVLMYEGEHVGALQRAGITLRRVTSDSMHPDWELALLDPAAHAQVIVACQGDPVSTAVRLNRDSLTELMAISVPGQPRCAIYQPKAN